MSRTIILLISTFILSSLSAQNFIDLGSDQQGDNQQSFVKDLESLSYRMDKTQDSIWFLMTFHDNIEGDFGTAIGLDTNLNTNDGSSWNGPNTSMKYDIIIYFFRNKYFMEDIEGMSDVTGLTYYIQELDTLQLMISMPLSILDADGKFNLIVGSGGFDIMSNGATYDNIPNSGYFSIPAQSSIDDMDQVFSIFPNPASDHILIEGNLNNNIQYHLYDINGKNIKKGNYRNKIDISGLKNGFYFVKLFDQESLIHSEKIIIQ